MKLSTAFASLAIAITQVKAHGGVLSYTLGGTAYTGFAAYNTPTGQTTIQREWDSYNPILDATDPKLSCNLNGDSLGTGQLSATVAAGSTVVAQWNTWPHAIGPVMVYMASCGGSCTTADTSTLNWFKIDEAGLISGDYDTGTWGQGKLIADGSTWTSTIPASLAPGEYMLRHELLAIHTANQPQFYPECAQLIITGSGSATPPSSATIKLPGGYSASDPSIDIDVYDTPTATTYAIPGPTVWTG